MADTTRLEPDGDGPATPILPAHVEDTVAAIAKVQADHHSESGVVQRLVERVTGWIGRPQFIAGITAVVALWIGGNAAAALAGLKPWDEPPFAWLELVVSLLAVYVTVLILATQRRDDELASYRAQLTLDLAILGDQKSAKIIALLEEMRRDSHTLHDRDDHEAAAMSVAAEPQAVLDALKQSKAMADKGRGATR